MRLSVFIFMLMVVQTCCYSQYVVLSDKETIEISIVSSDKNTAKIIRYSPINEIDSTLAIPERVLVDGKTYKVVSLGDSLFYGNTGIKSVSLPNSISYVGKHAFANCKNLEKIEVGKQFALYGFGAFDGTYWLDQHPDGIVYIGKTVYTFKGILPETLIIKKGAKAICDHAFSANNDSKRIKEIVLPKSLRYLSGFDGTSVNSVIIPSLVDTIGADAFFSCINLQKVVFPKKLKKISQGAFSECYYLDSIILPKSLKSIDGWAFHNCVSNTQIVIPDAVENIGEYAFSNSDGLWYVYHDSVITHSKLRYIQIGKGVSELKENVFGYNSIDSVSIPANVTIIQKYAFATPGTLHSVRCESTIPPYLDGEFNPFGNVDIHTTEFNNERILYVPSGCSDAYKEADGWEIFNIIKEYER